ncbi:MAG: hypothetical protein OEU54_09680 [Gemmatimonadota bacterium]|nr:hypothetical protein [Gemmatimonadota bacterium]
MKSSLARGLATLGIATAISGTGVHVDVVAQEVRIEDSAVTLSSGADGRAELWLQLDNGSEQRVSFTDGAFLLNGEVLADYGADGDLVTEWRAFLREVAGADNETVETRMLGFGERLSEWSAEQSGAEGDVGRRLGRRLLEFLRDVLEDEALEVPATVSGPDGSTLAIAPGGVEFDELLGQLDLLRGSLRQLGAAAGEATDRLALIVHDDYAIEAGEIVPGHLALLDGELALGGSVQGNVLVLDGELVLLDGSRIDGDILQVGGDLTLVGEALTIVGEIVSDFSIEAAPTAVAEAPDARDAVVAVESRRGSGRNASRGPFRSFTRNLANATEELMGAVTAFIAFGVIGLLLVYFAQNRVEMVADTVRHEFARSFAMGLAAEVLFFPALLILAVLVITWPIVPFFVLATGLAMLAGYIAVAHGAGEMFAQSRYRYEWLERLRRSNSYYYVLSGLVLLLLPFAATGVLWLLGGTAGFVRGMVAFVATIGTWILMTAGFGSVLLTRAGSRSVVVDWTEGSASSFDEMVDTEVTVEETPADPTPDEEGSADA